MSRRRRIERGLSPFEIFLIIAIIAVIVIFGFGLNDDDENEVIAECEKLHRECVAFCLPNDPMCVENCNREAEGCRTNQSTDGLTAMVAERRCERRYESCKVQCDAPVNQFLTNPDGTLRREVFTDPQLTSQLAALFAARTNCWAGCATTLEKCRSGQPATAPGGITPGKPLTKSG